MNTYEIKRKFDHYELLVNGESYSEGTYQEMEEDKKELIEKDGES